ncbi:MAG: hypothetical protein R6V12_06190 [Candidatus Hydrogenedentota bacterium]
MKTFAYAGAAVMLTLVWSTLSLRAQTSDRHSSSCFSHGYSSDWSWNGGSAPAAHSCHQSHDGKHASLHNVPLIRALKMAAELGPAKVLASDAAKEVIRRSEASITISTHYTSQEQLLRAILENVELRVEKSGNDLALFPMSEKQKDEKKTDTQLTSIGRLALEAALERHVTLHLNHVPLEMALQMLKGYTGIHVDHPATGSRRSTFGPTFGPMVTIHCDGGSVSDVLATIAKQTDTGPCR